MSETALLECGSCGNLGIGEGPITCCDRQMERVTASARPGRSPELGDLLRTVLGMSESELDVCLCVMEGGEQTVRELAERTAFDRSSVARHLGHLVDLGVVEKRRKLLQQGGHVYVYHPRDAETVRRRFRAAFVGWVREAVARVEELNREKVEAIVETDVAEPQWQVYRNEPEPGDRRP